MWNIFALTKILPLSISYPEVHIEAWFFGVTRYSPKQWRNILNTTVRILTLLYTPAASAQFPRFHSPTSRNCRVASWCGALQRKGACSSNGKVPEEVESGQPLRSRARQVLSDWESPWECFAAVDEEMTWSGTPGFLRITSPRWMASGVPSFSLGTLRWIKIISEGAEGCRILLGMGRWSRLCQMKTSESGWAGTSERVVLLGNSGWFRVLRSRSVCLLKMRSSAEWRLVWVHLHPFWANFVHIDGHLQLLFTSSVETGTLWLHAAAAQKRFVSSVVHGKQNQPDTFTWGWAGGTTRVLRVEHTFRNSRALELSFCLGRKLNCESLVLLLWMRHAKPRDVSRLDRSVLALSIFASALARSNVPRPWNWHCQCGFQTNVVLRHSCLVRDDPLL